MLHNPVDKSVNKTANDDTVILHLHRKTADECALKWFSKALWDSGAGKCVISFDWYQNIPTKYTKLNYIPAA